MKYRLNIPGVDNELLFRDATKLMPISSRRNFLKNAAGLGSLVMLSGCGVVDEGSAENLLKYMSSWNDGAQGLLFNPRALAPEFSEAEITRPFRFNAFYPEADAPEVDEADWQLVVDGLVTNKKPWTLAELKALPHETQITRHVCIEGWSAIGKWSGVRLSHFLDKIGADKTAKYVGFLCEDRYSSSLDMATALHPQTQITTGFDGGALPRSFGFPIKIRVPTKLGFKNPKHVLQLTVTNDYPGGFWENQGYNWFSGL